MKRIPFDDLHVALLALVALWEVHSVRQRNGGGLGEVGEDLPSAMAVSQREALRQAEHLFASLLASAFSD